jgi:hypothetical protein
MRNSARAFVSLSALAAMVVASALRADTPPAVAATSDSTSPADTTSATPATTSVVVTPTPAPPYKRERPISSGLAATLAAGMPKYNPPPKPPPDEEDVDLRDVDKPRNKIIRLPKYTVTDKKPPVFRERDIYTSRGLAYLAAKRYLTPTYTLLNSIYIPFFSQSPTDHALAMYEEDERLQNMSDLKDTSSSINRGESDSGSYIKRLSDETYMRTIDYRTSTATGSGSKD